MPAYQKFRITYCEVCGSNESLTCHHIDPESKGCEQRHDIVTLCKWCHKTLHQMVFAGWFNHATAHFEMWLHPNRRYTRGGVSKFGYVRDFKEIAQILNTKRNKVMGKLSSRGLWKGQSPTKKARDLGAYKDANGWSVDKLMEIFS